MNFLGINQIIFLFLLCIVISVRISAQTDSIPKYKLKEISVISSNTNSPKFILDLNHKNIRSLDASDLSGVLLNAPSLQMQKNSRGETMFLFRGANERQTGIYFNSVPLVVPWDSRFDVSRLPEYSISSLKIIRGIPSVLYGANSLMGIVDISSFDQSKNGFSGKLSVSGSTSSFYKAGGKLSYSNGQTGISFSSDYYNQESYTLPENFIQSEFTSSTQRENSRKENYSFITDIRHNFKSNGFISGFFLGSYGNSGVPAEEGNSKPRYWKYPVWNMQMAGIHGNSGLMGVNIDYAFSWSGYKIVIDQFSDKSLSKIKQTEEDRDNFYFGKINLKSIITDQFVLNASLSGSHSLHNENFPYKKVSDKFTQNIFSSGLEIHFLSGEFVVTFGGQYDYSSYPETGNIIPINNEFNLFGFFGSVTKKISNSFEIELMLGSKSRIPSMREKFSDALGKFVINPDLKPERILLGELSAIYNSEGNSAGINLFVHKMNDGIIKINAGEADMRVNKDKILTLGAELSSKWQFSKQNTAEFSVSFMKSNALDKSGNYSDTLEYQPNCIASVILTHSPLDNILLKSELSYVSKQYARNFNTNNFIALPENIILNLRASYSILEENLPEIEVFLRINNVFDRLNFYQLGLPMPGRELRSGFTLTI